MIKFSAAVLTQARPPGNSTTDISDNLCRCCMRATLTAPYESEDHAGATQGGRAADGERGDHAGATPEVGVQRMESLGAMPARPEVGVQRMVSPSIWKPGPAQQSIVGRPRGRARWARWAASG